MTSALQRHHDTRQRATVPQRGSVLLQLHTCTYACLCTCAYTVLHTLFTVHTHTRTHTKLYAC
uniref:Uncharacterized protein n=1 Tax=Anguilla anguilla TaxID=7936 RepID=A0A0E9PC29_ANGAN